MKYRTPLLKTFLWIFVVNVNLKHNVRWKTMRATQNLFNINLSSTLHYIYLYTTFSKLTFAKIISNEFLWLIIIVLLEYPYSEKNYTFSIGQNYTNLIMVLYGVKSHVPLLLPCIIEIRKSKIFRNKRFMLYGIAYTSKMFLNSRTARCPAMFDNLFSMQNLLSYCVHRYIPYRPVER